MCNKAVNRKRTSSSMPVETVLSIVNDLFEATIRRIVPVWKAPDKWSGVERRRRYKVCAKQETVHQRQRPSARDFSTGSRSFPFSHKPRLRHASRSILAIRRTNGIFPKAHSDHDEKACLSPFDRCSPADRNACKPYPPLCTTAK